MVIKISEVSKKFKDKVLYENISLEIEKGKTVGIVGGNGVGKSVLFKMIAGLEDVDRGSVKVKGNLVGKNRDFTKGLGVLINQPGFIEFYDGFTNLKILAEIQNKISDIEIKKYMSRLGLDFADKTKVKNYSTGMKQKLGICQAIMENQDLILLDEPFNALDFKTNVDIMKVLKEVKNEGKTLLLISHQHEYLEKICDEMYIVLDKKLVKFDAEIKRKYFMY